MPSRPWYCPSGIQDIEFSTGFFYKMNLDIETLDTVHSFGGYENALFDVYRRNWVVCDRIDILQKLDRYSLPDFENFDRNIEGTKELYENLTAEEHQRFPEYMRFVFGCILYHQLMYHDEDELEGWYIEAESD